MLVRLDFQRERVNRHPVHRPRSSADALVPMPLDARDTPRRQRYPGQQRRNGQGRVSCGIVGGVLSLWLIGGGGGGRWWLGVLVHAY